MISPQPDHESNTPEGISYGPPTAAIPMDKPSGPTLGTRLIIFSALVLPSALIPLLVLRRSVNSLHRKIDELSGATRDLRHEFKSIMLELSVRREQHERLQAMISETREGLEELRGKTQRMGRERARADVRTWDQVQELVSSDQTQISRLRQLGTSLADIAAFMQEIQLRFTPGIDERGIERLRFLAMQFEGMGKVKTADAGGKGSTDTLRDSGSKVKGGQ
ncbi:hypothetical protein F5148DRAFT_1193953 [Russula earlei]|uniref:Uncharacterized protein n=1 Tax=Russula earlei TaxID=71964 RepID=A0ACC0UAB5_9AGAM|nr:hypothetical protein F5148DRAFT_1193953 [Russula earlei]